MTEKYKILAKYIKDSSSETPDVETYLFVKENISKYKLKIDIKTKPLKNALLEINITFTYKDDNTNEKKSFYEITYAVIVKINDEIKEKKDLEKIILCDIPKKFLFILFFKYSPCNLISSAEGYTIFLKYDF